MVAEVLLAAVAEPDAEDLGDLLSLVRGEALVEGKGTVPFASAGLILVSIPMATGQADASAGFLDELQAGEIGVVPFVFLGGHGTSRDEQGEHRRLSRKLRYWHRPVADAGTAKQNVPPR